MVTQAEREDRQLTALRRNLGQRRTRVLNKIHRLINRHNLIWNYPTQSFQTQAGRRWLERLSLPEVDQLEMEMLLEEWTILDKQIIKLEEAIAKRASQISAEQVMSATQLLMTAPGVSHYSGLTLASRIVRSNDSHDRVASRTTLV